MECLTLISVVSLVISASSMARVNKWQDDSHINESRIKESRPEGLGLMGSTEAYIETWNVRCSILQCVVTSQSHTWHDSHIHDITTLISAVCCHITDTYMTSHSRTCHHIHTCDMTVAYMVSQSHTTRLHSHIQQDLRWGTEGLILISAVRCHISGTYITSHHHMTWHDMTWHDITWHDMTWHDMTWHHHVTSQSRTPWPTVRHSMTDVDFSGVFGTFRELYGPRKWKRGCQGICKGIREVTYEEIRQFEGVCEGT